MKRCEHGYKAAHSWTEASEGVDEQGHAIQHFCDGEDDSYFEIPDHPNMNIVRPTVAPESTILFWVSPANRDPVLVDAAEEEE